MPGGFSKTTTLLMYCIENGLKFICVSHQNSSVRDMKKKADEIGENNESYGVCYIV